MKYSKDMKLLKQVHQQHKKDFEFKNSEKIETMNKENQILLDRLLHISTKQNPKSVSRKTKKPTFLQASNSQNTIPFRQRSVRPKSLNLNARLIEDQKIREENIKIAQSLYTKKPVLDFKALKEEYVNHK